MKRAQPDNLYDSHDLFWLKLVKIEQFSIGGLT